MVAAWKGRCASLIDIFLVELEIDGSQLLAGRIGLRQINFAGDAGLVFVVQPARSVG